MAFQIQHYLISFEHSLQQFLLITVWIETNELLHCHNLRLYNVHRALKNHNDLRYFDTRLVRSSVSIFQLWGWPPVCGMTSFFFN